MPRLPMMPIRLKLALFLLSLSACAELPPVPHHVQYGVYADVNPPGFYGVDNETKAHQFRSFTDPRMKAAQCLTASDYAAWSRWISAVEQEARQRCH
jgi:hypothetical protein